MASKWLNTGLAAIANGDIDLLTDTIKVMLVKSSYAFDADHEVTDFAAEELGVSGYTGGFGGAGRKSLASKTVTKDDSGDKAVFDAADLTWTALAAGETIGWILLLKEVTNDAASIAIAVLDPTNLPTNGGNVTITWDAAGILSWASA